MTVVAVLLGFVAGTSQLSVSCADPEETLLQSAAFLHATTSGKSSAMKTAQENIKVHPSSSRKEQCLSDSSLLILESSGDTARGISNHTSVTAAMIRAA